MKAVIFANGKILWCCPFATLLFYGDVVVIPSVRNEGGGISQILAKRVENDGPFQSTVVFANGGIDLQGPQPINPRFTGECVIARLQFSSGLPPVLQLLVAVSIKFVLGVEEKGERRRNLFFQWRGIESAAREQKTSNRCLR